MTAPASKKEAEQRKAQSIRDKRIAKKKNTTLPKPMGATAKVGTLTRASVANFQERVSYLTTSKSTKGDGLIVRGQDIIQSLSVPSASMAQCLCNIQINPQYGAFAGTRLERYSQLYEKYIFRKLKFHVQTGNPTSYPGSYVLSYDRDMADVTPTDIKIFFAMDGTRSSAVWKDLTIDCPLTDNQDFYYTNYTGREGRLTNQGQLYFAAQTDWPATTVPYQFTIWVEYEVYFMIPQLDHTQLQLTSATPSSYSPLLMDSTTDKCYNLTSPTFSNIKGINELFALKDISSMVPGALYWTSPGNTPDSGKTGSPTGLILPGGKYEILAKVNPLQSNTSGAHSWDFWIQTPQPPNDTSVNSSASFPTFAADTYVSTLSQIGAVLTTGVASGWLGSGLRYTLQPGSTNGLFDNIIRFVIDAKLAQFVLQLVCRSSGPGNAGGFSQFNWKVNRLPPSVKLLDNF